MTITGCSVCADSTSVEDSDEYGSPDLSILEDAAKQYELLIEFNPKNASLWIAKGNWLITAGKVEEAFKAYDLALDIGPNNADIGITRENPSPSLAIIMKPLKFMIK